MILGGEALSSSLDEKWANTDVKLINTYGPTETAIVTSVKNPIVDNGEINDIGILPCGRAWVVHPQNHHLLLPRGAVGELLVEGPNLAHGYFCDEEQTARVFVSDVEWAPVEARFYKTGDLVRFSITSESLIFVGRKDAQVKIRGQRVELLEVATHVQKASGALDAVAEFARLADQPPSLVAFLRLDQSNDAFSMIQIDKSISELTQRCEKTLLNTIPSYMVPGIYIPVTAIPMTSSGKVDRRMLRHALKSLKPDQITEYRLQGLKHAESEPLNTREEILLASLWAKVLCLDATALHGKSNFFRSGGDSLTAMRLSGTAREKDIQLSVSDIFRSQTLTEMSKYLSFATEGHCLTKISAFRLLPPGTAGVGDPAETLAQSHRRRY